MTTLEIDCKPVKSSNIKAIGFLILEHKTKIGTMRVKFKNGTYDYNNVPEKIYKDMIEADSVGSYFFKIIKGKFPFNKLTDDSSERTK